MMRNFSSFQDALRKLEAKNRLVHGGTQYSPDVSLDVAAMAGGREAMRKKKPVLPKPVPLRKLVKNNGY